MLNKLYLIFWSLFRLHIALIYFILVANVWILLHFLYGWIKKSTRVINISVINIEENNKSNDLVQQPIENLNYNADLLNFKSLLILFANRIVIVILQQLVSEYFCKNNPKLTLICTMFDQYFPITSTCVIVPMLLYCFNEKFRSHGIMMLIKLKCHSNHVQP